MRKLSKRKPPKPIRKTTDTNKRQKSSNTLQPTTAPALPEINLPTADASFSIINHNCLEGSLQLPANSIDAIVTDPPYGMEFMGAGWDGQVPGFTFWKSFLYVAKPGAHLLAFGGTRVHHHLMVAIEKAGWEIRDCLGWLYGSGFPKSMDVSKSIDKKLGKEREVIGEKEHSYPTADNSIGERSYGISGGKLAEGQTAERTALPITAPGCDESAQWEGWGTALKPAWEPIILARKPVEGSITDNVLKHGVGALNIDASRVPVDGKDLQDGRFPANILHDSHGDVVDIFPKESARFFYSPKAGKAEREDNPHPTVKPLALMRYLVKLITPPGGIVMDPFTGSGSTGVAAVEQGFRFLGFETEADFHAIAQRRVSTSIIPFDTPTPKSCSYCGRTLSPLSEYWRHKKSGKAIYCNELCLEKSNTPSKKGKRRPRPIRKNDH